VVKVAWTKLASRQLGEIFDYISLDSEENALAVGRRIEVAIAILSRHPESGRPGRIAGTREFVVPETGFIIGYRVGAKGVRILRIQRDAKSWPLRF
jgi:toxin ParE1/3/4